MDSLFSCSWIARESPCHKATLWLLVLRSFPCQLREPKVLLYKRYFCGATRWSYPASAEMPGRTIFNIKKTLKKLAKSLCNCQRWRLISAAMPKVLAFTLWGCHSLWCHGNGRTLPAYICLFFSLEAKVICDTPTPNPLGSFCKT